MTFPDYFMARVLGAVSVVIYTSYNFSIAEQQHGLLVFSYQLILILCFKIYELESVCSMVKYLFRISWIAQHILSNFLRYSHIYSLSCHLSASDSVTFLSYTSLDCFLSFNLVRLLFSCVVIWRVWMVTL